MPSILEQYRISDFLEWYNQKKLKLNPDFQRGSVWTPAARTYLIDTILRQLPIPKIYLRTVIDIGSKTSFREVVDGQQRLRTIIDFANDKFELSKRAGEFQGLKYTTLPPELQEKFLGYAIAVDQLLNANDDEVLEVFARLNSYSVQLNAPEKRHARFQGELKWAVRRSAQQWKVLWETYGILGVRQRVRMLDDSLMAEMYQLVMEGVCDGGQSKIDAFYRRHDAKFEKEGGAVERVDRVVSYFVEHLAEYLSGTPLLQPPHFLMLFGALAHAVHGIPKGELDEVPNRAGSLGDLSVCRDNLLKLATVIDTEIPPEDFGPFWAASKASTHRISSRRIRFPLYFQALLAQRM